MNNDQKCRLTRVTLGKAVIESVGRMAEEAEVNTSGDIHDILEGTDFRDEKFWLEHVCKYNNELHQVCDDIENNLSYGHRTYCLMGSQECFLDLPDKTGNKKYDQKMKWMKDAVRETLKMYGNQAVIRFDYWRVISINRAINTGL